MILLKKLQELGWYLTEEGLQKLTANTNSLQAEDVNKIVSLALDWDLRDIAAGALPSKPDSNGTIQGRIVLQLQKMRNISAPKANEESSAAPRFLQLELSDGVNNVSALEFERIPNLNLNVPPGTKLFVKTEKLKLLNGFLVLKASDIQVLGGKVEALIEKWELAKQMLKYARSNRRLSGSGGPPPWIAFGKRLDAHKGVLSTDKNFKSLQAASEKDKNSKENEEFNASRIQAIAEAAKAGQKKVFGGGQQNILDHNVKKIIEKGYSEEEAKLALKTTNNNLERALYNLKRRNNFRSGSSENSTKSTSIATGGRVRDRGGIAATKEEAAASKPQTNVSLFDFLTDKLPPTASTTNTMEAQAVTKNSNYDQKSKDTNSIKTCNTKPTNSSGNRFENNMSSSFAANRAIATVTSDDRQAVESRYNTFNRKQEERNQQTGNKSGKGGDRSISNKTKIQTQNYNKIQNQIPPPHNNGNVAGGDNIKRNDKPFTKEKEHTNRQSSSDYQSNKRSNDFNKITQRKPYQAREVNRTNHDSRNNSNNYQQKRTQNSNNNEKDLDNLAKNTLKLSIHRKKESSSNTQVSGGRNHQQASEDTKNHKPTLEQPQNPENHAKNSNTQHQSHFTDARNLSSKTFQPNIKLATYSRQLGNGFAYDPSKIMGFQSKEANEYAMNMLKNQGMTIQQLQLSSTQVQHATPIAPSAPQQHPETQILTNQSSSVTYMTQNPNIFVAPPQQAPSQFGMISSENWPWKEGDLCLAKYWDDGNYYNAKITAISEKTCVVLFLGYGNHEEVLKSDCVPITDVQHIPLNAYHANISAPISQPSPPIFQQTSSMHSGAGDLVNQRFRGERQVYVPPPKRN